MLNKIRIYLIIIFISLFLLISINACTPSKPIQENIIPSKTITITSTPEASSTPRPTRTPKPTVIQPTPEPITFDNICEQIGQEIEIEGILHLPDQISCTQGGNPGMCIVQLIDIDRDEYMQIGLNVQFNQDDPINNYMADLPYSYQISDFKVRTHDGELIGEGDLVRLTGNVVTPLLSGSGAQEVECSLEDITKVEKINQTSMQTSENLSKANLEEAVNEGWVNSEITGAGLSQLDIDLESNVDFDIELSIEEGTIFISQSSGIQNMVLRKKQVLILKSSIEITFELEVSCANMELKEPDGDDSFIIGEEESSDDLIALLNNPDFRFQTERVQQFAIWIITDNPARNNFTGITDLSGLGGGPTDDELNLILKLFQDVGLDISKYQAFD